MKLKLADLKIQSFKTSGPIDRYMSGGGGRKRSVPKRACQ